MDQQQQQQRTVYSHFDRQIAAGGRRLHRDRPRPLEPSTAAKLRYLDDDDDDGRGARDTGHANQQDNDNGPASKVMFEKCQGSGRKTSGRKLQHKVSDVFTSKVHQQEHSDPELTGDSDEPQPRRLEDEALAHEDDGPPPSLEEVYLCSCCGVTRPLDPAMKFMPLFRGAFLLFNFLVFAFNFANLALGLWFRIDPKVYEIHKYIETQNFTYAGYVLLAGGLLGCLMALAGFGAAARVHRRPPGSSCLCLLISYALTMTLLTVAFIGALVLLTVYGLGAPLERFMNKEIFEQMRRRTMASPESGLVLPNQNDATQFLDFVQVKLRCCGAQDWRDYNKLGLNVPTTCYTFRGNMIDAPGCGRALRELFDVRAGLAAATTAACVLAQLLATVLASLMVCSIYNYRASPRPASAASYVSPAAHVARSHATRRPSPSMSHLDDTPLGLAV